MRAAQTQSLLAAIERLALGDRGEVLKRVGPADLQAASSALPIGWLPMSLHMRISDHLRDVVGPERNVDVWQDAMATAFERAFLKSFVTMTVSIFGLSPGGLFRRADKIYEHVTRDLGAIRFEPRGDHAGVVSLRGFPASRYRFICYVEGLTGCLAATIQLHGLTPHVTVIERDDLGDVRYDVAW